MQLSLSGAYGPFVLYRDRPLVFTNRHAVEELSRRYYGGEKARPDIKLYYGAEVYRDAIAAIILAPTIEPERPIHRARRTSTPPFQFLSRPPR